MMATTRPSRTDDLISDAAMAALRGSGYRHLWNLTCEVRDGVILLTGKVPSFYLKQMAQSVILSQIEANGVRNLVEVSAG